MTFQPWKYANGDPKPAPGILVLQWGHDFSAMEIVEIKINGHYAYILQWGHDFSAMEIESGAFKPRRETSNFNGAMTFQPWKLVRPQRPSTSELPYFNGAMTFQPWKYGAEEIKYIDDSQLQWGHDFSAMEMRG